MSVSTRKQIKDNAILTTKQDSTQIGSMVNDFINLTLQQISDPAWAFDRRFGGPGSNFNHLWSWLKRKTTFTTTSGTEDYVLERDVDRVAILRQTSTPIVLFQVTDELFFKNIPNPTESGNPRLYRLWEIDGVSTRLAAADKIDVISSSASDGTSFSVVVTGYVSGRLISESYTLNGTTVVAGTNTFDAREIIVSKSANTTGNITFRKNSDSSTLVVLGPQEVSPRFKVVTLYPKPGSTITMYLEYYKRIKELVNDTDVPEFDSKWHYAVTFGTIAKIFQYLGKTSDYESQMSIFASAVRSMVASDLVNPDLIEVLGRRRFIPDIIVRRSEADIT